MSEWLPYLIILILTIGSGLLAILREKDQTKIREMESHAKDLDVVVKKYDLSMMTNEELIDETKRILRRARARSDAARKPAGKS